MTRQDPVDAPELVSREDPGPRHESVVRPPVQGPDVDGSAVGASTCASPAEPRRSPVSPDGEIVLGDGVRARTHAQIDAEIARLGEVPMYQPSPPDPVGVEDAPPTPASPRSSDPVFAWLYRSGDSAPEPVSPDDEARRVDPVPGPAVARTDVGQDTAPLQLSELFDRPEPTSPQPTAARSASPGSPGARPRRAFRPTAPPPRRRRGVGARIALVASVTVIAAALGTLGGYAGLGLVERGALPGLAPQQSAAPATSATPPSGAVPGQVWSGRTQAMVGVGVVAGCVAQPARDGNGNPVRYDASNLLDDDPATAWRCDDDTAPSLTFIVPQGRQLAEVGLINGYTKTDGADDTGRYDEYPRVLQVRWHLPDGSTHDQQLTDATTGLQRMRVPVSGPGAVRLEILRLTDPSTASATREAVVVSEVYLGAPVG